MKGNRAVRSKRVVISVVSISNSEFIGFKTMKQCGRAELEERGPNGQEGVHRVIGCVAWLRYPTDGGRIMWEDE